MTEPVAVDRAVVAVCGLSGSGKTTLLEAAVRELVGRGLTVGVVKHDVHGLDVDREGKDSDRLFRAGADVRLGSPDESVARNRPEAWRGVQATIEELLRDHDLVLVEGHKTTPLAKVWLEHPEIDHPVAGLERVLAVLPWGGERIEAFLRLVTARLDQAWRDRPLYGGVLVGGAGRRMGGAKHRLLFRGQSFLSVVSSVFEHHVERVVLLGMGVDEGHAGDLPQLADAPDTSGPMAGILSAMRWAPHATWVVAACDLPLIRQEAVRWLLDQRAPGRWAVVPQISQTGVEPLLAVYEPQSRVLFEQLVREDRRAPRRITDDRRVVTPTPPVDLLASWTNVNTPDDLAMLE